MPLRKTADLLTFYNNVKERCTPRQIQQLVYILQRMNADKIRGMELFDELGPYFVEDDELRDEFGQLFVKEYNVPASMAALDGDGDSAAGAAGAGTAVKLDIVEEGDLIKTEEWSNLTIRTKDNSDAALVTAMKVDEDNAGDMQTNSNDGQAVDNNQTHGDAGDNEAQLSKLDADNKHNSVLQSMLLVNENPELPW